MATKAHLEGNKRYLDKLDEIKIRMEKGKKEAIKTHAEKKGESVNSFINRAINETIEREKED